MSQSTPLAYPTAVPTPPPTGRRSLWSVLGIACCGGCGLISILVVVVAVVAFRGGTAGIRKADSVGQQFIREVQANQLDKAYALTSKQWHDNTPMPVFKRFVGFWQTSVGDLKTIQLKNQYWRSGTGGTQVDLGYQIEGSKGSGQVTMTLVVEEKQYLVRTCNFSPTGVKK